MTQNTSTSPVLPDWVRSAVFYELYPQSFFDSDGDGIGDLEGAIRKLDYVKSLGATAIWLNPFFASPMRDAGYDVSDYYAVDPRYGTNQTAKALFASAKQRGLRVIVDLVPGHTSIDHPWFKESARMAPSRPFKNWYIWTNSAWDNGGEPWSKKMIHGYSNRNGNFLINFYWSQPALNFGFAKPDRPWQLPTTHEDVQALWAEMRNVMRFWLEMGASGFRVDMADSIIRNDPDRTETRRFWRLAREELSRDFPDLFLVAEGHPSSVLDGSGFHSAFMHWANGYWQVFRQGQTVSQSGEVVNADPYFSRSENGDFRPYLETWKKEYAATRDGGVISVPIGNHDLPRFAVGQSDEDLAMIFAFNAAWESIPFIYYGDEIGLRQQSSDNPIHEGHYPTRNGARTPMQWTRERNFGFSECNPARLYLPVDPNPSETCVESQESDPNALIHAVRRLNQIRTTEPALFAGSPIEILAEGAPGEPLVFLRGDKTTGQILCALKPSAGPCEWVLPNSLQGASFVRMAGGRFPAEIAGNRILFKDASWGFFKTIR